MKRFLLVMMILGFFIALATASSPKPNNQLHDEF